METQPSTLPWMKEKTMQSLRRRKKDSGEAGIEPRPLECQSGTVSLHHHSKNEVDISSGFIDIEEYVKSHVTPFHPLRHGISKNPFLVGA